MRGRKNGAPASSPTNDPVTAPLRSDEVSLDEAYEEVSEALRLWRRDPDDPGRKARLILAFDRKEDLLHRVATEDARLAKEQPVVPG